MKSYIATILLFVFGITLVQGQNEYDALIFSQFLPSGTARYTAMGGAFSALGADLSTMATNPAGTGLYRNSEIGMSTAWTNHTAIADYYSNKRTAENMSFQLTNMGFVSASENKSESDWKYVNFGFAYNHLNDYNKSYSIEGHNDKGSLLDKQVQMLDDSPGDSLNNAYYLANVVFTDGSNFYNDYNYNGNFYGSDQTHQVNSSGYAGEYDVNLSGNYKDKFYLGGTLGFQRINYSNYVTHTEKASRSDTIALVDFTSNDYLKANGNGFNFKFGMIYKINQMFRIGVALHTPTLYNMKYDYWTDVNANLNFGNGVQAYSGKSPRGNYSWDFVSPAHFILSGAAVIGKIGLVSAEVDYMDYSNMNISASDYYFDAANAKINEIYRGTFNTKLGGEVRLGICSLRAGLAYFDSPYKSSQMNSDAYKLVYSGGVGVNLGSFYFDAAYQYVTSEEMYYMYTYINSGVALKNTSSKFMTTIGFRF